MAEAKNNYNAEKVLDDDINQIAKNANDGGGFRDTVDAGETINGATTPVPIYIDSADGEAKACDANDQAKLDFHGFAISNSTDGNPIDLQTAGIVRGFTGLTIGAKYYAQDTAGTIGTSMGTYELLVGIAISATELLIQKGSFEYMGSVSESQSSASTGAWSGTFTSPVGARFAIIQFSLNGDPVDFTSSLVLSAKGKTSGSFSGQYFATGGGLGTVSFSWSGTTITITASTGGNQNVTIDVTGTAYFYK